MNFFLIILLIPFMIFAKGFPDFLPNGTHPRIHSASDIDRLSYHYSVNDDIWQSLLTEASYDDRDGMYAKALVWKATGDTSYLHSAISYLLTLNGPKSSSPTFTSANDYRWTSNYYPLTYDIVYDSLTSAQRIAVGDSMNEWVEDIDDWYTNPDYVFDNHGSDTDQFYGAVRTYVMVGVVTYDNGSTIYDNTNTANKANYLRLSLNMDYYMKLAVTTGYNWEGDFYNASSKRIILEAVWATLNGIGYNYFEKYSSYKNTLDNWVKFLNHLLPPNFNINQCLTYSDADNHAKQLDTRSCLYLSYLSLVSPNEGSIARWWANYLWGLFSDKSSYATFMNLWFDQRETMTHPSISFERIWFSEATLDSTTKQAPLEMYYATGTTNNDMMFKLQCEPYAVDHRHPDCGNFFFWSKGEKLIWEYRAYEGNFSSNGNLDHNTFQVYNPTPLSYDFLPRAQQTRNEGSGYPSADVGITRYKTNGYNYVYARADMYGQYRPRWYIYSPNDMEANPFVDTAWRSVIIIDSIIFMNDKNFWNGNQKQYNYRVHHTIWWVQSMPQKSGNIVYGQTTKGQFLFGHYLYPQNAQIKIVNDSNSPDFANCDAYNYPACSDLHYSVDCKESIIAEKANFLTVFYANENPSAKNIEYLGQTENSSISNNCIGAVVNDHYLTYVSIFSKDNFDTKNINFSFKLNNSLGARCVVVDLYPNSSYDIVISGGNYKSVKIIPGSMIFVDDEGVLAFYIDLNNELKSIEYTPFNLKPKRPSNFRINKIQFKVYR